MKITLRIVTFKIILSGYFQFPECFVIIDINKFPSKTEALIEGYTQIKQKFNAMKEKIYETPRIVEIGIVAEQAVLTNSLPDFTDGGEL